MRDTDFVHIFTDPLSLGPSLAKSCNSRSIASRLAHVTCPDDKCELQ